MGIDKPLSPEGVRQVPSEHKTEPAEHLGIESGDAKLPKKVGDAMSDMGFGFLGSRQVGRDEYEYYGRRSNGDQITIKISFMPEELAEKLAEETDEQATEDSD